MSLPMPALFLSLACLSAAGKTATDWPTYGNDPGGMRHSPLAQVNRQNVSELKIAWTYHTGDVADGTKTKMKSAFEATPIVVDGTMYFSTPFNRVVALDPGSGKQRWIFDPKIDLNLFYGDGLINRGVATWLDSRAGHQRRIFIATLDSRLIALDAANGKPCADFGKNGQVDLASGVDGIADASPGEYHMTSPPAVIGDVVVVGSSINDNSRAKMPSGRVRAFDARNGKLRWSWDPIAPDLNAGAANAWSILSVDPQRGLVFIPTGCASPDYYGALRPGDNRYANSLVALNGSTGKMAWHFQVVHHDLWDYDVASQPMLVTLKRDGVDVPAVVQGTKMGNLFVFHRETGAPLFPVEERSVPKSDVPGEQSWPTQPFPVAIQPLVPQKLSPEELWGATPEDLKWCKERLSQIRNEGVFTPPSERGSLIIPGNVGGVNWGGVAYDPERSLAIAATNRVPFVVTLVPRDQLKSGDKGPMVEIASMKSTPYALRREPLITPRMTLCNPPPWGALSAVDLSTGKLRWEVPLGVMPEIAHLPGTARLGSLNLGGPITTAGGLVFIGAARDNYLRAFDIDTGKEFWKFELPASAQATPMAYEAGGKQYVVIAAGGHGKLGTTLGDSLVAFSLP